MKLFSLFPNLILTEHPPDIYDVRGAVVIGRERVAVWDTLLHPENMEGVAALSAGKPITVVYSHADWDHIWGTAGLEPQEVIGHESCRARFADKNDVAAVLEEKKAHDARYEAVRLVPPSRTFRTRLSLDLGGIGLELYHLPGHTRDCTVALIPELGVLLGGDAVEAPLPLVYDNSPLGAWIAGLERWARDERVETVVPCHGAVGGRELLTRNIGYLQALRGGHAPNVPDDLSPFYLGAHEKNRRRAVRGS